MKLTQEQKDKIFDKAKNSFVTLNAETGEVYGRRLDFPIVKNAFTSVEYSWQAVDRILSVGGDFKS